MLYEVITVTPIAAVVVVLGTAIRENQEQPAAALHAAKARRRMADRRAHSRREPARHAADLAADILCERLIEVSYNFV